MAKRKSSSKSSDSKKLKNDNEENENGQKEEEEYEVEKIIHHRKLGNGSVEYLVRWKGYGPDDDTWEKEINLTSSALIIAEYKDTISSDDEQEAENTNGKDSASDKEVSEDEAPKKKSKTSKGRAKKKDEKKKEKPKGKAVKKKKKPVESDADDDDGEETTAEFEVEKITDVHLGKNGKKEYLVRWKGYSKKDDTWEPEAHLTCPDLIAEFNKKLEKIKSVATKSLRVAPTKTDRLVVTNSSPTGRHSKRHVGNRKSYAEDDA